MTFKRRNKLKIKYIKMLIRNFDLVLSKKSLDNIKRDPKDRFSLMSLSTLWSVFVIKF